MQDPFGFVHGFKRILNFQVPLRYLIFGVTHYALYSLGKD